MNYTFNPAQVIITGLHIFHYTLYLSFICQSVGLTNGVYIIAAGSIQVEEFAAYAAIDFLVAFLVVTQRLM